MPRRKKLKEEKLIDDDRQFKVNPDGEEIYEKSVKPAVEALGKLLMETGLPYIVCIQIQRDDNSGRVAGAGWVPDEAVGILHQIEGLIEGDVEPTIIAITPQMLRMINGDDNPGFHEKEFFVDPEKKGPVA
jgi:hypothetical protein